MEMYKLFSFMKFRIGFDVRVELASTFPMPSTPSWGWSAMGSGRRLVCPAGPSASLPTPPNATSTTSADITSWTSIRTTRISPNPEGQAPLASWGWQVHKYLQSFSNWFAQSSARNRLPYYPPRWSNYIRGCFLKFADKCGKQYLKSPDVLRFSTGRHDQIKLNALYMTV